MLRILLLVTATMLLLAPDAAAHEAERDGVTDLASDLRSVVVSARLPAGVELEVLGNGERLRMRNDSAHPVTITDGGDGPVTVEPDRRFDWHLDEAHPDSTQAGPDRPAVPWRVDVDWQGRPYEVVGEVRWIDGPAPWPWLLAGLAAAGGIAAAARRTGWVAYAAFGVAVGASVLHSVGTAVASPSRGVGSYLPEIGCWLLATLAVVLLARKDSDGVWLGVLAAVGLLLTGGWPDASVLWHSTVVSVFPSAVDRLLVTALLSAAAGSVVALLISLRTSANSSRSTI